MKLIRPLIITVGLVLAWQAVVSLTEVPFFILPSPILVAMAMIEHADKLLQDGLVTLGEILGGLLLGIILGTASALAMGVFRPARQWLMPVMVVSQAIPVFALAPILVLWIVMMTMNI